MKRKTEDGRRRTEAGSEKREVRSGKRRRVDRGQKSRVRTNGLFFAAVEGGATVQL